ncbi:MAG: C-terminal binding protein [Actinomycetales bacterium]
MATETGRGKLLITPHQFPHLDLERQLADEFDLDVVVATDQADLEESVPDATIVLVTPYGRLRAPEFERLERCRGVVRYGIGYDNIDVEAAKRLKIPVSIVPDASTEEVASHAFALGLMLARRIPQGQQAIRTGGWAGQVPASAPVLSELRAGIIGMGRIGRHVAACWKAVGAQVTAYDPVASFDDVTPGTLEDILSGSDVVSLHVPLTEQTRHLVSRESIALMRPGAVVVNVSRGGLVDEEALADALREGHLAGAGLDVFEQEPLPSDHVLRGVPNAVLTPHSAWKSTRSLAALQAGAVSRARALLQGMEAPDRVA